MVAIRFNTLKKFEVVFFCFNSTWGVISVVCVDFEWVFFRCGSMGFRSSVQTIDAMCCMKGVQALF